MSVQPSTTAASNDAGPSASQSKQVNENGTPFGMPFGLAITRAPRFAAYRQAARTVGSFQSAPICRFGNISGGKPPRSIQSCRSLAASCSRAQSCSNHASSRSRHVACGSMATPPDAASYRCDYPVLPGRRHNARAETTVSEHPPAKRW